MLTIRDEYESAAQRARQESSSYERYLLDLTERERETRRSNRIERLLRDSRLFVEKSLSTLDLKRLPPKAAQQVRSLLEGDFVEQHENVLIFGNPGSGKTHLACAIGQELIRAGRKVMFATCGLMVQDLLAAKRDLKLRGFLKKISSYHVLILDDIGYVQYSREEMEVLFTLLAERYERGSVVLTSNLAFSGWETIFKDPMTTAAAIDRLVHHSVILELNVPSYRAEQAKKAGQKPQDLPIPARRCDWKQARIPPRARRNLKRPRSKRPVHDHRGGNSNCRHKGNVIVASQTAPLRSGGLIMKRLTRKRRFLHESRILAMTVTVTVAVGRLSGSSDVPGEPPLLLRDQFERAEPTGWKFTDPAAWRISLVDSGKNRVLEQFQASKYEPPVRSPLNIAFYPELDVGDFILDVKVRFDHARLRPPRPLPLLRPSRFKPFLLCSPW